MQHDVNVGAAIAHVHDAVMADGQPRAEVTLNDETVVYHATMETPPACP